MKVLHYEGLANHIGPEPHGGCGNTMADAWVGESAGGLLSSEITAIRVPTLSTEGEGHTGHSVIASYDRTLRSRGTWHAWMPHARESGGPESFPRLKSGIGESRQEKAPGARMVARHQCKPELGTRKTSISEGWAAKGEMPYQWPTMLFGSQTQHSTEEAGEQEEISTSAESVEGRT